MRQDFTKSIKDTIHTALQDVHTCLPGAIIAFDADACTARVLPRAVYTKPDGTQMDFPEIFDVPVLFAQGMGGNAIIAYPVMPGDGCLLLIAEQSLDLWRTGAQSKTDLRFDVSNAVAIVGFFAQANPYVRRACEHKSIVVRVGASMVEVSPDGIDIVTDNEIKLQAAGDVSLQAAGQVSVQASQVLIN